MRTLSQSIRQHLSKIVYLIMAAAAALGVAGGLLASGGVAGATTTSHTSPSATARHYSTVAAVTHSSPAHSDPTYTVRPGDTLSQIAQTFGISLASLEAANVSTVPNPDLIYVGQVLQLDGATQPVSQSLQQSDPAPQTPVVPQQESPAPQPVGSNTTQTPQSAPVQAPTEQSATPQQPSAQPVQQAPQQAAQPQSTSGFNIPGMSPGMASCIAYRESTNGTNPAANDGGTPNYFGIIPASGRIVAGMSLAQQEQVAGQIYASAGGGAWAADGCPGT